MTDNPTEPPARPHNQVFRAGGMELADEPLEASQVLAGQPRVAAAQLWSSDELSVGVWQHTAGRSSDVEADEVFVVLGGRATIDVAGGPTLQVATGDVGFLTAGSVTEWIVHEDLRKVYFLLG